jgi:surface antigen
MRFILKPSLLICFLLSGCAIFGDGDTPDGTNCVPYARDVSGILLFGDAHEWWRKADGTYAKGKKPKQGAVLVLAKTNRLRYGHLAVVNEIENRRLITVDHANWWPGEISEHMPVMDVSPNNDWTQLRFWNEKSKAFGQIYPALGFIYPKQAIAALPGNDQSICIYSDRHG